MAVDVGVMLPLRIETRFDPGRLRLRIVPDEPWFVRHDPKYGEGEVTALTHYLDIVAVAASPAVAQQAWGELVAHVGGPRAVFLMRTAVVTDASGHQVVRPIDPSELQEEPALPVIVGFPAKLHVWLARAGGEPELFHTLGIDHARLLADFPDPDAGDRRWWEDWDEAVAVGMAADVELTGDPGDIDVLYVTGFGDKHPKEVFALHRDAGVLGLLAPGTPTNAVGGAPAASLAQDPQTWWDILQGPESEPDRLVSLVFTGDPGGLGPLPGPDEPRHLWGSAMVSALWPALWGFAGNEVWGVVPGTADAAEWATRTLLPEGPYPTVRVGSQPYGVLPATVTRDWVAAKNDPEFEAPLLARLTELRRVWAGGAEGRGTVVDATTKQLLDLLSDVPTSPLYRHRRAWPLELWWLVLLLTGFGTQWQDVDQRWREQYKLLAGLGLDPVRRYGARAASRRVDLPLVVPLELPAGSSVGALLNRLVELARESPGIFTHTRMVELEGLQLRASSLLVRLAIRSLQVVLGDVGREKQGEVPPGPEPLLRVDTNPGRLEAWIAAIDREDLARKTPATLAFRRVVDGLRELADVPEARLEDLLRATLDTATHRIDPWLVGPPARRLRDLLDAGEAELRLGAHGWVDHPAPGTPGPTPAGLVHAPSPAQAITATVLRDRAVNDPDASRWDIDLTSATVRTADRIAEQVRTGAHLAEALGREVERVVGARADVERLRRDFPARTEHAGRRVCDGQKVLAALPATLGLDAARLAALVPLREALDTYADLLVAEAVYHVTEGRADVAGAVMDAAAGLSRPPHLGLLHTPRQGRTVTSSVVVVLDAVAEPSLPAGDLERAEVPPAALADASTAAFLVDQLGGPASWTWTVESLDTAGATVTVTLDDLGLAPAGCLALARTDLERLVLAAGAADLLVAGDRAQLTDDAGSDRYERAARLVAVIGKAPAGPDAVTEQADAVIDAGPVDGDVHRRYVLVHTVATALDGQLGAQLAMTAPDGGLGTADPAVLTRLVTAARSWGIAPDPPPEVTAGTVDPIEAATRLLVATAARARALLAARLAAAPAQSPAADLSRDDLVAALVTLASSTGQLAVTSRLKHSELPSLAPANPTLDADWLPVIAAVREPLARVEVHQLAVGTPAAAGAALVPFTTKPDDPWQTAAGDTRRLVVAYAAGDLDLGSLPGTATVAVATVDRWSEVVPDEEQTTAAAFGFDAPGSRAPQAILLAVPPDLDQGFGDEKTVVRVVADCRELGHARMARPADLPVDARGLLPSVLLPANGRTAVSLEARI